MHFRNPSRSQQGLFLINLLVYLVYWVLIPPTSRAQSPASLPQFDFKETVIEDFDDGVVELESFPEQDWEPESWGLDSENTYAGSPYSLLLYGNTWKIEQVDSHALEPGETWEVAAFTQGPVEIHGFGLIDSANVLFYAFAGSEQLDTSAWVTVYQGAFADEKWNRYPLPVADDWLAYFGYLPTIEGIVFINDNDSGPAGLAYFDAIADITDDLPAPPTPIIGFDPGSPYLSAEGERSVDVQFYGNVNDPDSQVHQFFWDFGDDSTSMEQNPLHTFLVIDDHPYRVLLKVVDDTGLWGYATFLVTVDPGGSSLPISINFVGDIMLARGYEQTGGIIPTQGVEAIFEPTKSILGDAADISVANMESPLTDATEHHPTKPIYFKSSPDNVAGIVYAGIDIVSIGNNHILDYLLPGLQQTQSVLGTAGIVYSGAGAHSYEADLPAFYSHSGLTMAFLASSDRTGQYNNDQPYLNAGLNKPGFALMTEYVMAQQIAAVRDFSDFVVIETHSGTEYAPSPRELAELESTLQDPFGDEDYYPSLLVPDSRDRTIRQSAIDSGADLVICHHPHVIQGIEVYDGKVIAHSLGNFTFDLRYPETFPSMVFQVDVDESGCSNYAVTPVYVDDWIPVPAVGRLGQHVLDYLARRSQELDTCLYVDRDETRAYVLVDPMSADTNTLMYTVTSPLIEEFGSRTTGAIALHRRGHLSSLGPISPESGWWYRLGRETIWFGNFEDEGSTLWNVNSDHEWYENDLSYEGERSLAHRRLDDSGINVVTNLERRIKRYEFDGFTLHGRMRSQNGAGVTIQARYFDSRYGSADLGTENIGIELSGDQEWTFAQKKLTVPWETNYFDIRLFSNCPDQGEALSWFDNVGLIEWTPWQQITGTVDAEYPNDFYFIELKSEAPGDSVTLTYSETEYGHIYLPSLILDQTGFDIAVFPDSSAVVSLQIQNAGDSELEAYIQPFESWIEAVPNRCFVDPGASQTVEITIGADGLAEGVYVDSLTVRSNDPYASMVYLPVTLSVNDDAIVFDLSIQRQGTEILLSWSPVPQAIEYHIYRSERPFGPWEFIGSAQSNEFTDEIGSSPSGFYHVTVETPSGARKAREVCPAETR